VGSQDSDSSCESEQRAWMLLGIAKSGRSEVSDACVKFFFVLLGSVRRRSKDRRETVIGYDFSRLLQFAVYGRLWAFVNVCRCFRMHATS